MDNSDAMLAARAGDFLNQCSRFGEARFSAFYDGAEQAVIKDKVTFPYDFNIMFYGGFDGAERKILGVFPEWEEAAEERFPIRVLKISSAFKNKLSHRDYLGTLMAQGIDRNKTGDIIITENAAYVFVAADIAGYLADNIKKIGNQGVKTEICSTSDVEIPKPKRERIGAVCASLRLDAVIAAVYPLSRSQSAKLINSSLVKVNYRECSDVSYIVKKDDLISVRGSGRFVFVSSDGETRKGRLHITAEKYI